MCVPLLVPIHSSVLGTIWNSCVTFGKFCDSFSPSVEKNTDNDNTYFILHRIVMIVKQVNVC